MTCIAMVYATCKTNYTREVPVRSTDHAGGVRQVSPTDCWDFNWDGIDDRILLTPSGCWHWQGATTPNGYGRVKALGGPLMSVHRVMYEKLVGPIPAGMQLDHLCRNRACCWPGHLEPVTPQQNALRGEGLAAKAARKTHCPRNHPYDEENTYHAPGNRRVCRACRRLHVKAFMARKKAAA